MRNFTSKFKTFDFKEKHGKKTLNKGRDYTLTVKNAKGKKVKGPKISSGARPPRKTKSFCAMPSTKSKRGARPC